MDRRRKVLTALPVVLLLMGGMAFAATDMPRPASGPTTTVEVSVPGRRSTSTTGKPRPSRQQPQQHHYVWERHEYPNWCSASGQIRDFPEWEPNMLKPHVTPNEVWADPIGHISAPVDPLYPANVVVFDRFDGMAEWDHWVARSEHCVVNSVPVPNPISDTDVLAAVKKQAVIGVQGINIDPGAKGLTGLNTTLSADVVPTTNVNVSNALWSASADVTADAFKWDLGQCQDGRQDAGNSYIGTQAQTINTDFECDGLHKVSVTVTFTVTYTVDGPTGRYVNMAEFSLVKSVQYPVISVRGVPVESVGN